MRSSLAAGPASRDSDNHVDPNGISYRGDRPDNLYRPVEHDGGRNGRNWQGRVLRQSLYTRARLHPRHAAVAGAAPGLLLAWGYRAMTRLSLPEWLELLTAD